MTRGPGFLPHLVEFAVEYGLPVSDNDWENVIGPLYHRLSLKANEWYNIQRYWVDNLQHSSDRCRNIRDIILRKKNGLPFTHPSAGIVYNDNAATSAAAIQGLQETIQGLRETIQGLRETIESLQQQLANSNGANADVDPLTNDDNGGSKEEGKEEEKKDGGANPGASTYAAPAAATAAASQGDDDQQNIWEQYSLIPRCTVDDLFSEDVYSEARYLSIESFPLLSLTPLGQGAFGKVYCTRGPVRKKKIALKVIPKEDATSNIVKDEIRIQLSLPFHENILQLYSYFAEKKDICLVLEFAPSGSLYEQERPFSAVTSARYIREVCNGLSHIHKHKIIHRDVKMENLVLGSDGRVKIIDFGEAKFVNEHTNTLCGTILYQSPEMILLSQLDPRYDERRYDHRIDIWSIGVLVYEFHYEIGKDTTPFRGSDRDEISNHILHSEIFWPEEQVFSENARDLISRILVKDPGARPSLNDILVHPFIQDADE